jgi:cytochrome c553
MGLMTALGASAQTPSTPPAAPAATKPALPSTATPAVPAPAPAPAGPAFATPNLTPNGVRSMAATCSACHGTNGASVGGAIGGLAGLNKDYFVTQMKNFKEGKRDATLMHQISKGYSDAEIAALADYFSMQKR